MDEQNTQSLPVQLDPQTSVVFEQEVKKLDKVVTDTDNTTITFNLMAANNHTVTLGGNRTLAIASPRVGQRFIIRLVQDGTGSRTVTWFDRVTWANGTTPTLTTTPNRADVFEFLITSIT